MARRSTPIQHASTFLTADDETEKWVRREFDMQQEFDTSIPRGAVGAGFGAPATGVSQTNVQPPPQQKPGNPPPASRGAGQQQGRVNKMPSDS